MSKIKEHLTRNKIVYISGGACLVAGSLGGFLVAKNCALVNVRPIQMLTYKSTQTVEVFIEALGDPGNIIQDITTGTIYASQNQAARALGVNPARITEHLSGKLPNVQGHTLIKLGKASVVSDIA